MIYSGYGEAWSADELWSSLILVFVFWSCGTGYIAATRAFSLSRRKAMIWFLVVPVVFYMLVLGVIGVLFALTDSTL